MQIFFLFSFIVGGMLIYLGTQMSGIFSKYQTWTPAQAVVTGCEQVTHHIKGRSLRNPKFLSVGDGPLEFREKYRPYYFVRTRYAYAIDESERTGIDYRILPTAESDPSTMCTVGEKVLVFVNPADHSVSVPKYETTFRGATPVYTVTYVAGAFFWYLAFNSLREKKRLKKTGE